MSETATTSLARTLWEQGAAQAAQALAHPFVRGVADGTLPRRTFADFVAQDAFFLETFCRAYGFGLAHSPDRRALDTFAGLLAGVREELRLHASYARWVDTYADPGFEDLAVTIEGLVDDYADDTAEVRAVYARAMQLEVDFFDAAWGR